MTLERAGRLQQFFSRRNKVHKGRACLAQLSNRSVSLDQLTLGEADPSIFEQIKDRPTVRSKSPIAQRAVQALSKGVCTVRISVIDKDQFGLSLETLQPVNQTVLIRVVVSTHT